MSATINYFSLICMLSVLYWSKLISLNLFIAKITGDGRVVNNGRLYKSVSGYDRQVAPDVTGPRWFAVNKYSIGTI